MAKNPRLQTETAAPSEYKTIKSISFTKKNGEVVKFPKGFHVTVTTFKGKLILSTIRGIFIISEKALAENFRPFSKHYKNDGGKVYGKARQRVGTHARSKAYNTISAATADIRKKRFNDLK